MPTTVDKYHCYYYTRQDQLPDGTTRIWNLELRPANADMNRNRHYGGDEIPVIYTQFPDTFIFEISCEESALERQIGLQSPPMIKITCLPIEGEEEFADLVSSSGDYENSEVWLPIYEVDSDIYNTRQLCNTWLMSYSDDGGTTWKWWFAGVQQPNEIMTFKKNDRGVSVVSKIELTIVHITHWLLTQIEFWTWGKKLIHAGSVDEDFEFRLQHIAYDTTFQETFIEGTGYSSASVTRTVNYTENWGAGNDDRDDKDEAYFVKWLEAFNVLRAILNKGLNAHRIYSPPSSDQYRYVPMQSIAAHPTCTFFEQNYNTNGELGAELSLADVWIAAAIKAEDSSDYLMGLFVNTLKSNGYAWDGETTIDGIANLIKGFGNKGLYRTVTDGDDPLFTLDSYGSLAPTSNVKTLDGLTDFYENWEFTRGELIARGACFNVSAESDNDTEFRVYASGNQDRDDIECKMQMHNMPSIRNYKPWHNTDTTANERSYREAGYTLRRFWYLDQPTGLQSGKADYKMPIRMHEYIQYNDGVKNWGNANGNPFTPIERSDNSIKPDMLLMQRNSGMPFIIARILSKIYSRQGIGKLTATLDINKADYNDVGAKFDITIPASFKQLQNGTFYLESVKPDFATLSSDCVFIFIPDEV